jgi:phage gp46-like protein
MSGLEDFEGDLYLADTEDGGDIRVEEEFFVNDKTFNTAVYLSLFGGNKEDAGKIKNSRSWWGNMLSGTAENEKMVSRFQAVIAGKPMTAKNIQEAENAAELDLKWLKSEGAADGIKANGRAASGSRFLLDIKISAAGETVYDNTFALFWKAGVYGV